MDDRDERLRARLLTRDRGTFCDAGAFNHPGPYRRYAITVEGEPLRVQPVLCPSCGDRLLLGVGHLIGIILRGEETGGSHNQVPAVPPSSPPDETEPRPPVLTKGGGGVPVLHVLTAAGYDSLTDWPRWRCTCGSVGQRLGGLPDRCPDDRGTVRRLEVTETPAGPKLSIKPVKR